jgi:hypothetical protein
MTEPPAAPEPPERTCPRCGAPHTPDQEYCLECGLRLGGTPTVVRRLETAWRERFSVYPGDWMWPALLGLVIAVVGATAAILLGASSGSGGRTLVTPTGGSVHEPTTSPVTATAELPTVPSNTPTASTATVPTTPPPATSTTPRPPGGLISWPSRNGFTVVLESIPTSAGRSFAVARAQAASRSGLPQVGVLNSGGFSSLHPGYYVVFSGVYGSQSQADQARLTASAKGYPAAYAREIRR